MSPLVERPQAGQRGGGNTNRSSSQPEGIPLPLRSHPSLLSLVSVLGGIATTLDLLCFVYLLLFLASHPLAVLILDSFSLRSLPLGPPRLSLVIHLGQLLIGPSATFGPHTRTPRAVSALPPSSFFVSTSNAGRCYPQGRSTFAATLLLHPRSKPELSVYKLAVSVTHHHPLRSVSSASSAKVPTSCSTQRPSLLFQYHVSAKARL